MAGKTKPKRVAKIDDSASRTLRERAEAGLRKPAAAAAIARLSAAELKGIVHELQVHQMELEIQNDELRRAQLELAHSRDRYTDLYEFAPVGYLSVDLGGIVREANLTAAMMLGVNRGKMGRARLSQFVVRSAHEALSRYWPRVLASDTKQSIELELKAADVPAQGRNPTVIELQSLSRVDTPGEARHCRVAMIDISERKRAGEALKQLNQTLEQSVAERTKALRESEQDLADFFMEAPIGLMWVSPDGRIERINQAQLDMMGCARQDAVGHLVSEHSADPPEILSLLERLARKETVRNHRARLQRLHQPLRHILIDANGRWKAGKLAHSRWFVRDVTDRVELERELLATSERERERFGHDLHDDLCQQLAAIECLSDTTAHRLARSDPKGAEEAGEISELLRRAIEHARDLARGLSPTMLFEGGGLAAALQDLADSSQRIFKRECLFHCTVPAPIRDRNISTHLYRIAQEALGNAIKHGRASRIDIQLMAKDNDLILGIRDNGIGLPSRIPAGKGMGLRIIQYRAGIIHGSLAVQRGAQGGTAVICTIRNALPRLLAAYNP